MLNAILFIFLGAAVGSAALCLVERDDKKSWITGRSACPECQRILSWYELIPIISYVIQKGRCRGCKCKIPVYTIMMEIYGGISGYFVYQSLTKSLYFMVFILSVEILGYIVCMIALRRKNTTKK